MPHKPYVMEPIRTFEELTSHLKKQSRRKRVAVVWAKDSHTEYAIGRALKEGIADFVLVGDSAVVDQYPVLKEYADRVETIHVDDPDEAARQAVNIARAGQVDVLMKGSINTDNLLKAILNKEEGLLPKGRVLTHLAMTEIPTYHKLLCFTDAAVIPYPTLEQRVAMIEYAVDTCRKMGVERPRVGLIHFTEKVNPKFPNSTDYVELKKMADEGRFGDVIMDGPFDVRTACDVEGGELKGIDSPVGGEADILVFPNIESGNVFYKTISLFGKAEMAGLLQGPTCPVVVSSRSDSGLSKYNSLAMACLQSEK